MIKYRAAEDYSPRCGGPFEAVNSSEFPHPDGMSSTICVQPVKPIVIKCCCNCFAIDIDSALLVGLGLLVSSSSSSGATHALCLQTSTSTCNDPDESGHCEWSLSGDGYSIVLTTADQGKTATLVITYGETVITYTGAFACTGGTLSSESHAPLPATMRVRPASCTGPCEIPSSSSNYSSSSTTSSSSSSSAPECCCCTVITDEGEAPCNNCIVGSPDFAPGCSDTCSSKYQPSITLTATISGSPHSSTLNAVDGACNEWSGTSVGGTITGVLVNDSWYFHATTGFFGTSCGPYDGGVSCSNGATFTMANINDPQTGCPASVSVVLTW